MINFKQLRKQNGYTQTELGQKCGMKQQYINMIETGKISPTIATTEKILGALGYVLTVERD